jgi:hypothetical protein
MRESRLKKEGGTAQFPFLSVSVSNQAQLHMREDERFKTRRLGESDTSQKESRPPTTKL